MTHSGSRSVKFQAVTGTDSIVKHGVSQTISVRHHCITSMREYESKSLEELRLEDYAAKGTDSVKFQAATETHSMENNEAPQTSNTHQCPTSLTEYESKPLEELPPKDYSAKKDHTRSQGDVPVDCFLKSMDTILDVTKCEVCLEAARRDFSQCVNSHFICMVCKTSLSKSSCPTCLQPFSNNMPSVFVRQIIDALPQRCKHLHCTVYLQPDDDHETYCGWQTLNCRICNSHVYGKDLLTHVETEHKEFTIFGTDSTLIHKITNENEIWTLYSPTFVFEQFLWVDFINCPFTKIYSIMFSPIPNGNIPKETIYAKVQYSPVNSEDKTQFTTTLKLNLDPTCADQNKIYISRSMLPHFINDKKEIHTLITYAKN